MKNLFLIIVLAIGLTANANRTTANITVEHTAVTGSVTEVDTFCKLIQQGNFEAVKGMIAAGIDINKKSVGMTPLMYAARQNKVAILKLLIANGADLKIKSSRGYSALKYAEMSKAHDAYTIISKELKAKKMKKKGKRAV